jgi:iron(III) transport system substrate-binding protein
MKKLVFLLSFFVVFALAAAGAQNKKVVAYTAHEDNIISAMVPKFKAETGYDLEFVKLASGDVMKRIEAEASNPQCDVIWSIGGEQLEADANLLTKYTPKEWDKIAPVFKVGTNWLPYTGIMNVLIVNTKLVSAADMPKGWADLGDPKWKGKISSATPDKSGSAYMQMNNVFLAFKDKGWDMYKPILANFFISASSGAVPKFVNDGEASIGITLEDNAYRYVQGGGPVKIVYPVEGVIAAPDGIALVKGAPHPDAGKVFIDWCLSKSTQDFLVSQMFRRPVRLDGVNPPGLPPLSQIKTIPYDFAMAATYKGPYVKEFNRLRMELGL